MKHFLCLLLLTGLAVAGAAERPARLLGAYSGYFLGGDPGQYAETLFRPMADAKFNMVELKIQQNRARRMNVAAARSEFATLAEKAKSYGLWFQIYLYPEPYDGQRKPGWPEHQALPALVDAGGNTHANAFSIIDYEVWNDCFRHAFAIAELSKELPIGALKFDIETISNTGISYDDAAWKRFTATHPGFDPATPASGRVKALTERNAMELYRAWFIGEFDQVVRRLEKELHAINPKLSLGVMPATHGWVSEAFIRLLGTPEAPAVIDDWSMYNGEGFQDAVLARQKTIKNMNPNNLYIPWFRINSYTVDQLASNAYYAGAKCDGYSNWTMSMMQDRPDKPPLYCLPANGKSADYYAAYREANAAIREDIAAGTLSDPKRIAYEPVKSLVPPLNFDKVTFPKKALRPKGNGSRQGTQQAFSVRNQTVTFIYAEAGTMIEVTLRHLAGAARPISLHYALLDRDRHELRNEAIQPGDSETFSVRAPATGLYALVASGGLDGQAWYSIDVKNPYWGFDASAGFYFFSVPFTVWMNAKSVHFSTRPREAFSYRVNGGAPVNISGQDAYEIPLPGGTVKFSVEKPNPLLNGFYSQNVILTPKGGSSTLLFASPERMLEE